MVCGIKKIDPFGVIFSHKDDKQEQLCYNDGKSPAAKGCDNMSKTFGVLLWFDVEDYITPEADDALLGLLKMLDRLGIRGTFKLVGEKGRVMAMRGRQDIFRLLARQEVGYHTATHSLHPVPTEYLKDLGFAEGAAAFENREQEAFDTLTRLLGQQMTTYGQPGGSWASQVFPVLRKWGVTSCLDAHSVLNLNGDAFWYGGLLQFTGLWATPRLDPGGDPDAAIREVNQLIQGERPFQFLSVYYHPCEFACNEFWDSVNFSHGKNSTAWRPAATCSPEEMQRRIDGLERYLTHLLHMGTVFLTASEATALMQQSPLPPDGATLVKLARQLNGRVTFASKGKQSWSAAQLLQLLARYVCGLPLTAGDWYGPEEDCPTTCPNPVTLAQLGQAVLEQVDLVLGYPRIPNLYHLPHGDVSPVDAFATLAAAAGAHPDQPIPLRSGQFCCGDFVNPDSHWGGGWPIFHPDLEVPGILHHARLQTWTLRPAFVSWD